MKRKAKVRKLVYDKIMINLLSPQRQKKIKEEESIKIIGIIYVAIAAALVFFAFLLFFIRVFYQYELRDQEIILAEQEVIMKMRDVFLIEKEITANKALIAKIDNFYSEQTKVTETFLAVSECLPAGASLSRFDFSAGKISVGGISPTREMLALFKSNLEERLEFANVVFPASNWLVTRDVEFSASFDYVKFK